MSIDLLFEMGQGAVLSSVGIFVIFARLGRTVLQEGVQQFLRCLRGFEFCFPSAGLKHFVAQSGDKAKIAVLQGGSPWRVPWQHYDRPFDYSGT